ncbi:NAD(P)-dependent dehydrogenase (short-subunit alcohol dehydrogenase family) [Streptomyces collinus]
MNDPHPERLLGKVVVVTGAARGQGTAEAEVLTREGARVIATDATEAPGCRRLDDTREQDWAELPAELRESYGHEHGLVNNAGITWRARLGDVRPEDMARVHTVNVTGPLLGTQHLAPLMPPGSSVVNVGSSAALTAHCRPPSARPISARHHSVAPAPWTRWRHWSCSCCPTTRRSSPVRRSR